MSKLKSIHSNDGSENQEHSQMSLTGLRFVESILRTAGGRKLSIEGSIDCSEDQDFEESVIINNKDCESPQSSSQIDFSSNKQQSEARQKNIKQNQHIEKKYNVIDEDKIQKNEPRSKSKKRNSFSGNQLVESIKKSAKVSQKYRVHSGSKSRKLPKIQGLIKEQSNESQFSHDKSSQIFAMQNKYLSLQKQLNKVKRSFKRQQRTINQFLEYQLRQTIGQIHSNRSNKKDSKQAVYPHMLNDLQIKRNELKDGQKQSQLVESQIQNVQQQNIMVTVSSQMSQISKKTQENINKIQDVSIKTKKAEKMQNSQFQAYKINMFKSSKKQRVLISHKIEENYEIPQIEIQQFPNGVKTHQQIIQIAKQFFFKFEGIYLNIFDQVINVIKNQEDQIKILMTSMRTKKEKFMINWKKSGYFYIGKQKDEKQHQIGVIFCGKQYKYKGQFKDGKKEGKGRIREINGRQYFGDWKDDRENGFGEEIDENGNTYKGTWKDGYQDGKGTLFTQKGDQFEGNFAFGRKNGYGVWKDKSGDCYKGMFLNDKKHGVGEYYSKNQLIFKGEFKNGFKFRQFCQDEVIESIGTQGPKRNQKIMSTISYNNDKKIVPRSVDHSAKSVLKRKGPSSKFQIKDKVRKQSPNFSTYNIGIQMPKIPGKIRKQSTSSTMQPEKMSVNKIVFQGFGKQKNLSKLSCKQKKK